MCAHTACGGPSTGLVIQAGIKGIGVLRALQVKWSLWKFGVPAFCNVLLSLICYLVGWHLSDAASSMALQRAGAVATFFAIGFTLHDYRGALERSESAASATIKKVTDQFPRTGEASRQRVEGKLRANTARATRTIALIHASVLMFATLVWGFGDFAKELM